MFRSYLGYFVYRYILCKTSFLFDMSSLLIVHINDTIWVHTRIHTCTKLGEPYVIYFKWFPVKTRSQRLHFSRLYGEPSIKTPNTTKTWIIESKPREQSAQETHKHITVKQFLNDRLCKHLWMTPYLSLIFIEVKCVYRKCENVKC